MSAPALADRDLIRDRSKAATAALGELSEDALRFHQMVTALADPFFEGRSPDVRGNLYAADYVRFYFDRAGLTPAFAPSAGAADAEWFQPFEVPGEVEVKTAFAAAALPDRAVTYQPETDFNPLGFSGNGDCTGPLAFVGYSIAGGPEGYTSYKADDSLAGKIAVIFRYEPVNEQGKSKWTTFDGWSRHAALMEKAGEAVTRGAIGVVLINPPGVSDKRAAVLETTKATRFGRPIGVPAIMLDNDAAASLLRAASGKSLEELRSLADAGGHGAMALNPDAVLKIDISMERAKMPTRNVGGVVPGRGSLASEYIVIGAHYDHVGYGYVGGSNPGDQGKLHPGADDNASGTAGLILLAERFKKAYDEAPSDQPARSILFLAFSAEEMGLLGADHYVKSGHLDASKISAMINMDMIGRMQGTKIEVAGMGTAAEFEAILKPLYDASGLDVRSSASGMGPSDHASFHRAGLPVLHFFTGVHAEYHKPTDLPHLINTEGAVQVIDLVQDVASVLAQRSGTLTAQVTSGPQMPRGRAKVRLGVMPGDYSGNEPGVLVGDVYENTSAAKAGIKKGDRIIRWGGEELADAGVMMQRLVDAKPGDVVEIVVVRDGAEVTIPVTLLAKQEGQ